MGEKQSDLLLTSYRHHPPPYLAVAGEHEGAVDDLLSVRLGVAEMMLTVAVQDLLSFLYGVFGHQIGLSDRNL